MSEFEDKLNAILSNPEAMGQIMNLAQSLGNTQAQQTNSSTIVTSSETPPEESENNAGETASAPFANNSFSMLGNLDPRLIHLASQLMTAYQSNDDNRAALLTALRPFVKPERYAKLEQAIRISKMTRVIRIALDSFRTRDGGDDHV